jgi:uncharacterized protein
MTSLNTARQRFEKARIPSDLLDKWDGLLSTLGSLAPALVAYSGGVDSSFLAYAARLILGDSMAAVTIQSTLDPSGQRQQAAEFTKEHHIPHIVLNFDPLQTPAFRKNPQDRCYLCKKEILGLIWEHARQNGFLHVIEGQNMDDQKEYRPGRKAVLETGTLSPLAMQSFTKADIRLLAKILGLSVWNQPSAPCLATRFPYGTTVTLKVLRQVDEAEAYLHNWGFKEVRVRYRGGDACIEVPQEQIAELIVMRLAVVEAFKEIGFRTITVDMQGYRSGSMDEGIIQ